MTRYNPREGNDEVIQSVGDQNSVYNKLVTHEYNSNRQQNWFLNKYFFSLAYNSIIDTNYIGKILYLIYLLYQYTFNVITHYYRLS